MQSFITQGKWPAGRAMRKVQAAFAKELVPSCQKWSIGLVGVLDESGFEKSGTESVGVARQYCGRLGKVENCQVGVYLVGVTPDDTCPLDQQLFLPEGWIKDKTRRRNTQVPQEITYQSKPQIAAEMIRRTHQAGHVKLDWITGDSLYGDSGPLRAELEATGQRYVLAVRPNLTVWIADPGNRTTVTLGTKGRKKHGTWRHPDCRSLSEIAKDLPADRWHPMQLREGSIDGCIANDRWLWAGARGSGLPLEALRSLAVQGSIKAPWSTSSLRCECGFPERGVWRSRGGPSSGVRSTGPAR